MRAVQAQLATDFVGAGAAVRRFESALGGAHPGVSVACGTSALHLALLALDIGAGDEVVVPTYVCRSVVEAVVATGAAVKLCDIGPDWTVDRVSVEAALGERTRAVIVPHLYGLLAEVDAIVRLGVPVIEDRAQAIGHPVAAPLPGTIAVYSFHATKCMTTGEGGMAVAADESLARRLRELRDGVHANLVTRRVFAPLSDIAASLGSSQLARYGEIVQRRARFAAAYDAIVRTHVPHAHTSYRESAVECFRFVVRVRGGLEHAAGHFARRGISVRRGVDELMHRLLGLDDTRFPRAVHAFATSVSVPCHAGLSADEHESCATVLQEWLERDRPELLSREQGTH